MTGKPARPQHEDARFLPRFREAGDVTLDLMHRDGRVEDRWIGLHPREFALLWRLAERPGERVSKQQLLRDVWRLDHQPGTNSLAVHVARVRTKLECFNLSHILRTDPAGGYYLDVLGGPSQFEFHSR